ncbi:MAG TPA: 1-deoxy-D-xylulose-5-phosphate reductoisomerase, partial [Tepidisphaeraceae bacterium]|nr:1-deoxy-D-xylulose-5-phosphate reductoisomerase [Tepidisphaeraceae bacterium]
DRFIVEALSTHSRVDALIEQVRWFRPRMVGITSDQISESQTSELKSLGVDVLLGAKSLSTIASQSDYHTLLLSVVGFAGVHAAMACVETGRTLALANKEALVVAGALLMPLAKKTGATILPVDSEHSAIAQCISAGRHYEVKRAILTASGGALRDASLDEFRNATVDQALRHPTWSMGAKVTIDSATLVNKALELVEAAWLFDLRADQLDVVIHPQSVIHSMVEFIDGSTLAQLSPPDMRLAIQQALTHPERIDGCIERLDITKSFSLDFRPIDPTRHGVIEQGYEVIRKNGTLGAVFNAANETALAAFVAGKIKLGSIEAIIRDTMSGHSVVKLASIADVEEADRWARERALEVMGR